MILDREPVDPLGPFVGLRNILLVYVIVAALALLAHFAYGQRPECEHPVESLRIEIEGPDFGWRVFHCEICRAEWADFLPIVGTTEQQRRDYARKMDALANQIEALRAQGTQSRVKTMHNGVAYSKPQRQGPRANDYIGGTSHGNGWEIRWAGPYNQGPTAIEAVKATLDHLVHLQHTNAASEANAKLLVHLVKAIEEFDGVKPSMGGELNKLIPTGDGK